MKPVCEMPFPLRVCFDLLVTKLPCSLHVGEKKPMCHLWVNLAKFKGTSLVLYRCLPGMEFNWFSLRSMASCSWSAGLRKCLWPFWQLRKTPSGNFSQIWRSTSTAFYHDLKGSAQLITSIMFAFLGAWLTITLASVFVMFSFKPL